MSAAAALREAPVLDVGGERLCLLPERAVFWARRRTLIVADTHFGKSALLRRQGMAVPAGSDAHDLQRLSRLLAATEARRLLVLGDFLHGALAAEDEAAAALVAWRDSVPATEIVIVAGNHDRGAAGAWRHTLAWLEGDLVEDGLRFTHDADRAAAVDRRPFTLSGHVHPVARLGGAKGGALRVPVFWRRQGGLVLPAFGVFTGGMLVRPDGADELFAAGAERVIRLR
jgi:DNA ligase-associated metallophosphoesterase